MVEWHSLIRRQLHRCFGHDGQIPPELDPFIVMVNEAYQEFDKDRIMLERSLDLTSQELMNVNADNRAALEGLLDAYLRLDENGTIVYCRTGENRDGLLGNVSDVTGKGLGDIFPPAAFAAIDLSWRKVIEDGHTERVEFTLPREGIHYYYEMWLSPLVNRQVSVMIRDITENRLSQQREQELQHRLARSQRMESLGMLAGGVAHDLNNILSPLVAYPDMILDSIEQGNPARRLILQMQNSAIRASTIIQDLLALARRGNFSPEPVDLNRLVTNYVQTADFHVLKNRYPNVHFQIQLSPSLPPIEASANYIGQIVMNLTINAFEAIDNAGRVIVSTDMVEDGSVQGVYDVIPPGRYVRLRVADNGIGMMDKEIEHIFEPFFTRKKSGKSGGTGLGLTVVYGSVKDCKGYIDVVSKPGKGTEFLVYFPASSKPLPAAAPVRKSDIRGNASILVVDDIAEQRALASHLLNHLGYSVDTVASGTEAVDVLKARDFDLVVLDMILGDDIDGLDTFMALRKVKPDQKCIIVSGFSENDRVQIAIEQGVIAYVQKPYTVDALGRTIRDALNPKT